MANQAPPDDADTALTLQQVAAILNCGYGTARHAVVVTKELPGFKLGRTWRVKRSDLDAFMAGAA